MEQKKKKCPFNPPMDSPPRARGLCRYALSPADETTRGTSRGRTPGRERDDASEPGRELSLSAGGFGASRIEPSGRNVKVPRSRKTATGR